MQRERLLMETAMRIMKIFCDMLYACHVNPDKVDKVGSIERLQLFCDWAIEFEDMYAGSEEYEDDYIGLTDEFAQKKINETFGIDKEE